MGRNAQLRHVKVSELRLEQLGVARDADKDLREIARANEQRRVEQEERRAHVMGMAWDCEDTVL